MSDKELEEFNEGLKRFWSSWKYRTGIRRPPKLTDIAGSRTITTEQWLKTRKVLRGAEQLSRGKLRKTSNKFPG